MVILCKIILLYLIVLDSYVLMCLSKTEKETNSVVSQPKDNIFYYEIGDIVKYTCKIEGIRKYLMSWTQITGYNIKIPFPSNHVEKYSITLELDKFDDNSIWSCTVSDGPDMTKNISTIYFRTVEKERLPNSTETFVETFFKVPGLLVVYATFQKMHQKLNQQVKISNCKDFPYLMKNRKIVEKKRLSDDYNVCIKFENTYDSPASTRWDRIVDFRDEDKTTIENDYITSKPAYYSNATNEKQSDSGLDDDEDNDDEDEDDTDTNLLEWGMPWIIGIGCVVFIIIIIVIIIISIRKCRNRKKNTPTPEGLYATANEVVYADLQLMEVSSSHLPRDNVPYAKVIGVLNKKKKKPA